MTLYNPLIFSIAMKYVKPRSNVAYLVLGKGIYIAMNQLQATTVVTDWQ